MSEHTTSRRRILQAGAATAAGAGLAAVAGGGAPAVASESHGCPMGGTATATPSAMFGRIFPSSRRSPATARGCVRHFSTSRRRAGCSTPRTTCSGPTAGR